MSQPPRVSRLRLAAAGVALLAGSLGAQGQLAASSRASWELVSPPVILRPTKAVFDNVRNRVLVSSTDNDDASLWDWDGQQWTEWYPTAPRPDANNAAIAFDSNHGRLMLVTITSELWELDVLTKQWTKLTPADGKIP